MVVKLIKGLSVGCSVFLMLLLVNDVAAGVFTVTPVRIYMEPKDRATAITITNEGDDALVMQADVYAWSQKPDGQDELVLTEDVFLSPPIIKLAPRSRQVVRLAKLTAPEYGKQLTYRMIVREIPEAKAAEREFQLQVALAFSIPVFITPKGAKPILDCAVDRVASDKVVAQCSNRGTAHIHPTVFTLFDVAGAEVARQETGGYILPGIKREFSLKSNAGGLPAGKYRLQVQFSGDESRDLDVDIAG